MTALRDLSLSDCVVADVNDLPVVARDRWVVLLDDGRPVSAVAPGTTLGAGTPVPPIVVASAELDLNTALSSDAFAEVADASAVVLVDGGAVTGVWSGPSLAAAVMQGPVRTSTGPVLPGAPAIPLIVRSCTFTENGTVCATSSSFVSKPFPMPACPNAKHLSAHDFNW
jgi:hypothetical protein